MPYELARNAPGRLFVGIDASAAGLRELSTRAARAGLTNLIYVRAAVEQLPPELGGVADRMTVIFPWGSLLAAFARPSEPVLRDVRSLCQPGASLTVLLGIDPGRDRAEASRLDLPALDAKHFQGALADGYAAAGFRVRSVSAVPRDRLARWPSSWARRLAHGRPRRVFQIEAQASVGRRAS